MKLFRHHTKYSLYTIPVTFIKKNLKNLSQGRNNPVIISITSQILRLTSHVIGIVLLLNYAFEIAITKI